MFRREGLVVLHGLEKLVEKIRFYPERLTPHLLPGLFLGVGLLAISSLVYSLLMTGTGGSTTWYTPLVGFYVVYILASSISSYRLLKHAHRHLVDSGIVSYLKAKELGDKDAIIKLYRGGLLKKDLPSPITGLVLVIASLGIAYPVILYIVEKNLREHIIGEEKTFLYVEPGIRRIGVENLLVDLAATLLTLGFYMVYWSWRIVRVYNDHVLRMHVYPKLEKVKAPAPVGDVVYSSPVFIITGSLLVGTGLTGFLGITGFKTHILLSLGFGLLIAYYSVKYSRKGLSKHIFGLLGIIYLFFALGSIAGFLAYPGYIDYVNNVQGSLKHLLSQDLYVLARNIYVNNLVIASAETVPVIGLIYLGIGLGSASIYFGAFTAQSILVHSDPSPLLLFIMPHTFLELLAYALMATASTRLIMDREKKGIVLAGIGLLVLLLAAFVEAYTIVLSRMYS